MVQNNTSKGWSGTWKGRETRSLSLESKSVWAKGTFWFMKNVEDGGHLLFSIAPLLASLTKKLAQMSAVLDLWEYKGCERWVWAAFFVYYSSVTCWIWGWEKRSISCVMLLVPPGAQKSTGCAWHLLTGAFFTSEGAIWCLGVSNCCSQLITCFCFHLCCHVGDWVLLLSNNVGCCLGRGTCALMKILQFKQLFRAS